MKHNTSLIGPQIRCELRCKMKTKVHKRVKLVSVIHFSTIRISYSIYDCIFKRIKYSKNTNYEWGRKQKTNASSFNGINTFLLYLLSVCCSLNVFCLQTKTRSMTFLNLVIIEIRPYKNSSKFTLKQKRAKN